MDFRSSDREIIGSDKFSDIRVDTRRSSALGKAYGLGAKVGSSVVDLVGKTVGDVVKQQIRAAGGTNSNETMADSQGRAVKTSLQNATSLGGRTGNTVGKKVGAKVDAKVNNMARRTLRQPTKTQVNNLASRVVGSRSKRQARRQVYKELATGKTAPRRVARRIVNWGARSVSGIISKIIGLIIGKISGVVAAICLALLLVMLVLSLISSFLPAWLTGEEEAAAKKQQSSVAVAGVVAEGMGNDYPYKDREYNTANWATGYYFGNCTDFVIWRVNRDAGVLHEPWTYNNHNTTPAGGHGYQWALPTALPGWVTTDKPSPGDIISFQPGSQGGRWSPEFGHVAYIGQVMVNGSITVENYGTNEYFITNYTASELSQLVSTGQATIKHNPHSKVKIKKIGGSSIVDPGGGYKGAGGPLPPEAAKAAAKSMLPAYGWDEAQYQCLVNLWNGESGWNYAAENPDSGAYGIPQSLPADKMGSIAPDWRTNAVTQIKWGLEYIKIREDYGSPCAAWDKWLSRKPHWY
jgi:lytic transglycosylase catalytic